MTSKIPEEDLIDELQRIASVFEGVPTKTKIDTDGEYSSETYIRRFGSWRETLAAAGIEVGDRVGTGSTLSDEDRRVALLELADDLGHPPSAREMDDHGKYGSTTYQYQYGSWNKALRKFGLEPGSKPVPERQGGENENPEEWTFYWMTHEWQETREDVLDRDRHECSVCQRSDEENREKFGVGLNVTHNSPIDEFESLEKANATENLRALCSVCHGKAVNGMEPTARR
ncbi:homing endonuclease associated repeat-containing protein [Halobaculum rubrum]|uniref:homing endonuclease associated repeat-containing protein n=1 Tax=Halobaculum rubrum TaxID=2872158 RepID=UPI001CA3E730|nr:HNH endonuclease [Halobaculum rubrum]QZX98739.1 HNH endonuclease [Halobaculum rubrum]